MRCSHFPGQSQSPHCTGFRRMKSATRALLSAAAQRRAPDPEPTKPFKLAAQTDAFLVDRAANPAASDQLVADGDPHAAIQDWDGTERRNRRTRSLLERVNRSTRSLL